MKQDIKKAEAELNKVKVEVDTKIKSAAFQKDVAIVIINLIYYQNIAEGEASAILKQNKANVESITKLQNSMTGAYKSLKDKLNLTNEELMSYIKAKLIKNYNGNNLVLNLENPESKLKKA